MKPSGLHSRALFVAALAMLSLRALTPEGYMPGSPSSGLLFELCPSGMPPQVMRALSGGDHHHHHHEAEGESVQGTEQCPIGHMLATTAVSDLAGSAELHPATPKFASVPLALPAGTRTTVYRSRAPPA